MKRTFALVLLLTLAACEHPAENVRASLRSLCASQPNCDVNEAK